MGAESIADTAPAARALRNHFMNRLPKRTSAE
jgi:hypothetical protein